MSLRTLQVAPEQFSAFLFLAFYPKTEFGTDEQKMNRDGVPLWTVSLIATHGDGAEQMKVTLSGEASEISNRFASASAPSPLTVKGLRAGSYVRGGKFAEFYWTADDIRPVSPPALGLPLRGA